jgi:hypothetical protein
MRPLERASYQNAGERTLNAIEPHPWESEFKPGFRRQAEAVIAGLERPSSNVPDVNEAMRTMRLVHDIFAA